MPLIASALHSLRGFFAAQRVADELASLSDHELRDIGLSRSDISGVVEHTRRSWEHDTSRNDNLGRSLIPHVA